MENERLTFEQVCERYEFADWELAKLVEQGEIMSNDEQFTPNEILRFLRANPKQFFSFAVASLIYGKDENTIRFQANAGKIRGKKIASVWATNAEAMDEYMQKYARRKKFDTNQQ